MNLSVRLADELEIGNLAGVRAELEEALRRYPESPFSQVLDLKFSNAIDEVAAELGDFLEKEGRDFRTRTIYTEMNGFAWNTDLWFYNWFAYELPLGHSDLEMAGYDSENNPALPLRGMEALQRVFQEHRDSDDEAAGLCELLVIVRFQELIISAVERFHDLAAAIVVDAHDQAMSLEIRRHNGVTYLGRQHRGIDPREEIPTRFETLRESGRATAFRIGDFTEDPQWLHRVRCEAQLDEWVDCAHSCNRFAGKPLSPECGKEYRVICHPKKMAEGWPDVVRSNLLLISGRLRAFLMDQAEEESEEVYQWIDPVYQEGAAVPDVKYQILNLLDHRDTLDEEKTVFYNEGEHISHLFLQKPKVENCRHLFRIAGYPFDGIYASRQLAWALHDAGFSGISYLPVEFGR